MIPPCAVDGVAPEPPEENGPPGNDDGAVPETRRRNHPANKPLLPTGEYAGGKA